MSRTSRKRYERIYTDRAKNRFPPVSPVILHKDGTIEERPTNRQQPLHNNLFLVQNPKTKELIITTRPERVTTENLSAKIYDYFRRLAEWIRRL